MWHIFGAAVLAIVALALTLLTVFIVAVHATHTNERADPSAWITPGPTENVRSGDDAIYRDDPCVSALLAAMEQMEPFVPTIFHKEDGLWGAKIWLTEDGMRQYEDTHRTWEETKLQCKR